MIGNPEACMEEIYRYKDLVVDELNVRSQYLGMEGEVTIKSACLSAEKVMTELV